MPEMWDLIDKDGCLVGVDWPREDHDNIPEGLFHPCVEIWVTVGDRLLITKRHPDKTEGLKFDVPGGAVVKGESILLGARRELFEEVGINASEEELLPIGIMTSGKVYAASFLLRLKEIPEIKLQPSEVVGYKLVSKSELEEMTSELTRGTYRRYQIYKEKIL